MTDIGGPPFDGQSALAERARDAFRFLSQVQRARRESDARADTTALDDHLTALRIRQLHPPVVDADGVVTSLIYNAPHPTAARNHRGAAQVRIWACALGGRFWLRHAHGRRPAVDDELPFAGLADLGRILEQGPCQPPATPAVRAAQSLTQAAQHRGPCGIRHALIGLGWSLLAHAAASIAPPANATAAGADDRADSGHSTGEATVDESL